MITQLCPSEGPSLSETQYILDFQRSTVEKKLDINYGTHGCFIKGCLERGV